MRKEDIYPRGIFSYVCAFVIRLLFKRMTRM